MTCTTRTPTSKRFGAALMATACIVGASWADGPDHPETAVGPAAQLIGQIEADPAGWRWAVRNRSQSLRSMDQDVVHEALRVALADARAADRTGQDARRAMMWAVAARDHRLESARQLFVEALDASPALGSRVCEEIAATVAALGRDRDAWIEQLRHSAPCVVAGGVRQLAGIADRAVQTEIESLYSRRPDFAGTPLDRVLGEVKLRNDYAAWWREHPDPAARLTLVLDRAPSIFETVASGHRRPLRDAPDGRYLLARAIELRLADAALFDRAIEDAISAAQATNPPRAAVLRDLRDVLVTASTTPDTPSQP